jgi:hypothetical protein
MASWVDTPRCCGGAVADCASGGHLVLVVHVAMSSVMTEHPFIADVRRRLEPFGFWKFELHTVDDAVGEDGQSIDAWRVTMAHGDAKPAYLITINQLMINNRLGMYIHNQCARVLYSALEDARP